MHKKVDHVSYTTLKIITCDNDSETRNNKKMPDYDKSGFATIPPSIIDQHIMDDIKVMKKRIPIVMLVNNKKSRA